MVTEVFERVLMIDVRFEQSIKGYLGFLLTEKAL